MFKKEEYPDFIKYLRETLDKNQNKQENRLEVLNDFYIDYPPEGMINDGSDNFNEEIGQLTQNNIKSLEEMVARDERVWLVSEGDKWRLLEKGEKVEDVNRTALDLKLDPSEAGLILDGNINDSNIKILEHVYSGKVRKHGSNEEKYKVITLLAGYYKGLDAKYSDYMKCFSQAGEIGQELKKKGSYLYPEYVAKYKRSMYEHESSAENYSTAIEVATSCEESNDILLSLTRNMRIQYELCGDEGNASDAFIEENKLKQKKETRKRVKVTLWILAGLSNYCQSPRKVALWAFGLIILSAGCYVFAGITPTGEGIQPTFSAEKDLSRVISDSLYFSVVTFTTLGYGDFSPGNDFSRLVAGFEALGGFFLTSLFLVTLVRKYGR